MRLSGGGRWRFSKIKASALSEETRRPRGAHERNVKAHTMVQDDGRPLDNGAGLAVQHT